MIDIERLWSDIEAMASIGRRPEGGVSRGAFSPVEQEARGYLIERMRECGLAVVTDAAGNIFGRLDGEGAGEGAAVIAGSHIDSVEGGGDYDGVLGVFGALECVRTLQDRKVPLRRPVEVAAFADEEERFYGFLGSYAFTGRLEYSDIAEVRDADGARLLDAMQALGLDPSVIADARRPAEEIHAFVELHIEQGPTLDREGLPIGVVDRVKGNYRFNVRVEGRSDHAGAPPEGRCDAFMLLHRLIARHLRRQAESGDPELSCTIGRVTVEPNIETVQPGVAECSVDLRSSVPEVLRNAQVELERAAEELAAEHGAAIRISSILREEPLQFDAAVVAAIDTAAGELGYARRFIASGAGHDAQVIGRYAPAAMIFVPSVGGRSHCPEELTGREDIERGVNVLYRTLVALAGYRTLQGGAGRTG